MIEQPYTAKEAMERLRKTTTTFYREVREGKIPYTGKRPTMRFPKEAIDALAEVDIQEEEPRLSFVLSTIADAWTKQEITRQPYDDEDVVPFKTLLEWRKRNNEISMNVKYGNRILGWTTFLPLDEEVIEALLHNKMREKDIPFTAIKRWTDKQLSVYIPIIEIIPTGNAEHNRAIGAFLLKQTIKWAISLMIQHNIKNWYSIGVTPEGQSILEALGFTQVTNLDNGERKGYILEENFRPVKLLSFFMTEVSSKSEKG